jgi:RimJ/RimL family protein N-acetyltransferase
MAWASDPQVAAAAAGTRTSPRILCSASSATSCSRAICLAGEVSVTPTGDPNRAELGYVLARAHWGKGVATAAVKRTLATVFGEVEGLESVEALVDVANPASQRVLEKAGFTREAVLRSYCVVKGRLRDMVIYSFISTDPLVE